MSAPALASIGDHGVLNASLPEPLSGVWLDRDLGWLDFNERVLAEALDERTPLLERAKFLAIFTSNLDEFFMKRMAVLREGGTKERSDLLQRVRDKLLASLRLQAECYRDRVIPGLARYGVLLRRWDELTTGQQREASDYFDANLSPALTPLVVDMVHPFPFISNLSTSLAFHLHDPLRKEDMVARVRVPSGVKQWIPLATDLEPGQKLFVPLHEVIRGNAHKLYGGMVLTGATLFRLTRDAEVELDDDPNEQLREAVEEQVRQRRYEPAVRLEFGRGADPAIRELLRERFDLSPSDLYDMAEEMDYTTLFELMGVQLPELHDPAWTPLSLPLLEGATAFFRQFKRVTYSCITLTRVSMPAWSTSSARRLTTQRQFRLR
jgi:polyphosphate kinase